MTQQELYAAAAAHADSTLVKRLRERIADTLLAGLPYNRDGDEAADRIERLEVEVERLRLDVEAQEALQVSAYHAGLRAGWNFGVSDDDAGMQAALADTDHIKELRRIREARAALGETK